MLDLSILDKSELFEVKLLDGRELKLKRPTQSLQMTIVNILDNDNYEETLDTVFNAFTRVLNRNTEGITFNSDELAEEYGVDIASIVIFKYFTYWNENTQVDFQ